MPISNEELDKFLTAWHGTPHDFDAFNLEKIGTGEGAQVYGHGLYSAERRGIAEGYRDALSQGKPEAYYKIEGVPHKLLKDWMGDWYSHLSQKANIARAEQRQKEQSTSDTYNYGVDPDSPIDLEEIKREHDYNEVSLNHDAETLKIPKALRELDLHGNQLFHDIHNRVMYEGMPPSQAVDLAVDYRDHQNFLARMNANQNEHAGSWGSTEDRRRQMHDIFDNAEYDPGQEKGRLYELRLNTSPEHLLDWDIPLDEHHDRVQDAILGLVGNRNNEISNYSSGDEVYKYLASTLGSKGASEKLLDAGIHGIRYKDGSSRSLDDQPTLHYKGNPRPGGKEGRYLKSLNKLAEDMSDPTDPSPVDMKSLLDEVDSHVVDLENILSSGKPHRGYSPSDLTDWRNIQEWAHTQVALGALEHKKPKITYNYVMFDPKLMQIVRKYGPKGELLREYGHGVTLKPVDHDPFAE